MLWHWNVRGLKVWLDNGCIEFVITCWCNGEFYGLLIWGLSKQYGNLLVVFKKSCLWRCEWCWGGLKKRNLVTGYLANMFSGLVSKVCSPASLSFTPNPHFENHLNKCIRLHLLFQPCSQEWLRCYWASSHKSQERWLYASPSGYPTYNCIFIVHNFIVYSFDSTLLSIYFTTSYVHKWIFEFSVLNSSKYLIHNFWWCLFLPHPITSSTCEIHSFSLNFWKLQPIIGSWK